MMLSFLKDMQKLGEGLKKIIVFVENSVSVYFHVFSYLQNFYISVEEKSWKVTMIDFFFNPFLDHGYYCSGFDSSESEEREEEECLGYQEL